MRSDSTRRLSFRSCSTHPSALPCRASSTRSSATTTASFKLSLMLKDMRLALDAAARRGVELKLGQGATQWIDQAEQQGLGGYDYSAVVAHIRHRKASG